MTTRILFALLLLCTIVPKGEAMENIQLQLEQLKGKKIFFAHQSVGFNIIEGIEGIMQKYPSGKLLIKETDKAVDFLEPVFAHCKIGRNRNPISKIDDFRRILGSGVGDKVDIAFIKLCFVDVYDKTDIDEVFKYYVTTISALETKYPKVKFVHFTVPLTVVESGIKAKIKVLLGMATNSEADNARRNMFNRMLMKQYGDKVFDLAGVESTYRTGKKAEFIRNGQRFEYLIPEYSDDGGHLNSLGKEIVGSELIKFLANVK